MDEFRYAGQKECFLWDSLFGVMPSSWRKPSPSFPLAQSMCSLSLEAPCPCFAAAAHQMLSTVCQVGFEAWPLATFLHGSVLRASVCELPASLCNISPVPHVPFSGHILKIVLWPPPRLWPWQGSATADPLLANREDALSQWVGRHHSPKSTVNADPDVGCYRGQRAHCVWRSSLLGEQGRVPETEKSGES